MTWEDLFIAGAVLVLISAGSIQLAHAQFSGVVPPASYRHVMQPEPEPVKRDTGKPVTYSSYAGPRIKPCQDDARAFGLGCAGAIIFQPRIVRREVEIVKRPDGSRCFGTGCDQ